MSAPTSQFKDIVISTALTAADIKSERTGLATGGTTVDNGGSAPWDFTAGNTLTVDISTAMNWSPVRMLFWNVTANGGNTLADNFQLWLSTTGFDVGASCLKFKPLSFEGTTINTARYVQNAITTSYTSLVTMAEGAGPGSQNCYSATDGTSVDISTGALPSDVVAVEAFFEIATAESTGTYNGTAVAGYEAQCSFKYDYS